MIKRIVFYDFDGTLIDTPMPETGKPRWKEVTGNEYPHLGWWGRIESLSLDVFDIQAFPEIARKLKQDNSRSDTYTIILTSRLKKLQPYLELIMKHNNLYVDEMSPQLKGEDKDVRIREFLKRFPDVNEIDLYDDREKEFVIFERLKKELEPQIKVNIYKCNKGNISKLFKVNDVITDEVSNFMKEDEIGKHDKVWQNKINIYKENLKNIDFEKADKYRDGYYTMANNELRQIENGEISMKDVFLNPDSPLRNMVMLSHFDKTDYRTTLNK